MHTAYLLLGSNIGNRINHFINAEKLISKAIGNILKTSSVYETEPWGYTEQPAFLNKVILVNTLLSPHQLLSKLLEIETNIGRIRTEKWHERIIDIDILFYDSEIVSSEDLKIPHPHLQDRRFALEPLNEIAPDLIHPILKKPVSILVVECIDQLLAKRVL